MSEPVGPPASPPDARPADGLSPDRSAPPTRRRSRWWWRGLVVVAAAGVLATAIATDTNARSRDRRLQAELHRAQGTLRATRHRLASTRSSLGSVTLHRLAVAQQDGSTRSQLATTQSALSTTDAAAFLQGIGIGNVETCLGGVDQSFGHIATGDSSGAARAISAVSGACLSLAGASANGGLVYPFDFPDPDIVLVGTDYYGYATNSVGGNIQIVTSTDHVHWTALGNALPSLPSWALPGAVWAPSVAYLGGRYVMYYTVQAGGFGDGVRCISVATSAQPQGPFIDTSTAPLECQSNLGGSIDPSSFIDAGGSLWLVWKSEGTTASTALWSQPLTADGTALAPGTSPTQLLTADEPWQAGIVEGPDLVETGGRYFLFYSGNNWNSASYGIGVASCAAPQGPCTDLSSQPLVATSSSMAGPGGPSVFSDPAGGAWIAFHAWIPGAVGYPNSRDLYVRPLDVSGAAPVVQGAAG